MTELRRSAERGHANHGWLDTWHTFSFADYYNPREMGFGPLRVINDDKVQPGMGFGTHGHRDMEIITYVLEGALEHRDHTGAHGILRAGDVQWMTAGHGVLHSEMPHGNETAHTLQLWLNLPAKEKMKPAAYRDIPSGEIRVVDVEKARIKVIAGRFGDTTGPIHGGSTDPYYFDVHLEPRASLEVPLPAGHNAFLYVYEGEALVGELGGLHQFIGWNACHAPLAACEPGEVLDEQFLIGCGEGSVRILRAQRQGKGPQEAADFLRGFPLSPRTRLA